MSAGVLEARACMVIPVYNEEATISAVLDSVREHFTGRVVAVDDGSTDSTAELLARRDDIAVVRHASNRGYGASLIDGFAEATGSGASAVLTMDCDGQHEPAHIPEFLRRLELGDADVVSGSRYLPDSEVLGTAPPNRADINRRVTGLVNALTGWGLTDSFCGFKAYRASALARVHLREPGYAMPMEFWANAYLAGMKVEELPVERIYFDHDRSFGEDLDDPEKRYGYYLRVWEDALKEGE